MITSFKNHDNIYCSIIFCRRRPLPNVDAFYVRLKLAGTVFVLSARARYRICNGFSNSAETLFANKVRVRESLGALQCKFPDCILYASAASFCYKSFSRGYKRGQAYYVQFRVVAQVMEFPSLEANHS